MNFEAIARATTIALLAALAIAATACGADDVGPSTSAPAAETAIAPTSSPAPATTPLSPPPIDATPLVEVTGLFTDPRETRIDAYRSLGPKPSSFAPWDGTSTMLYDIGAGTETNLGPGSLGRFSPDNTKMVWIADPQPPFSDGEAWMIDLASGEKRDLGPAAGVGFVDDNHVGVTRPAAGSDARLSESIDLATGATSPIVGCFEQCHQQALTPDGYVLSSFDKGGPATFDLTDPPTGKLLLSIEAFSATPAGRGYLAVATAPLLDPSVSDAAGYHPGTTNIFLVEIGTGHATFVATASFALPNWPLTANDQYVVWSEAYCGAPQGKTRVFERATGEVIELDATLWPSFTPAGLIRDGAFGGDALIDPATLQYTAVIPAQGDSSWSSDYRYASLGQFGGHGGLCP